MRPCDSCSSHPERLPRHPQALEEPAPCVRDYGFDPREGKTALKELSLDRKDNVYSYIRGRKLATLGQTSPLASLFGPLGLHSVFKK